MPFRSLRTRLVALVLVSLLGAGVLFAVLAARQFSDRERDQSERRLLGQAPAIAQVIAKNQEQQFLTGLGVSYSQNLERATFSTIYYASNRGLKLPFPNLPELPAADARRIDWRLMYANRTQQLQVTIGRGTRGVAAAAPLFFKEKPHIPIGAIVLVRPVRDLSPSIFVQTQRMLAPVVIAVVGVLLIAVFLSRRITRPVAELTAASERIAAGDYDVHLRSKGNDELGVLATRFEQMAARLKESSEHERNFLMRISHELRTPLTSIQGHVLAIADGVIDDPDDQHASLEIVLAETQRLQRLVGDLLDLARLESRRFSLNSEQVDLRALCERASQTYGAQARDAGVTLAVSAPAPAVVIADGDRVLQVVGNLVANALRWTPPGGEVVLSLGSDDGRARVSVSDTGPGVPPELRERVMRPFVSGDASGTGLGLAVATELASAMGGRLEVGDGPAGGARFTLVLPLATGSTAPAALATGA